MAKRKNEQVRAVNLERLSRNPRPSRQEKTLGGKPLFQVPHPLSEVRESIGMSQWQLANASGVPRSAIANYELGRYAFSARDGIELFIVLARNAAPKSLEYRKAKENAAKLVADQRELCRKSRLAIQCQREALGRKDEEVKGVEADIDAKEARLREI